VFQWQGGNLVPFQPNSSNVLKAVPPATNALEYPKKNW
jgi:hypothetical protein